MTKYKSLLSPLSMMHSHRYYMHLHAHIRGAQNRQNLTKIATFTNFRFMVNKSEIEVKNQVKSQFGNFKRIIRII